MENIFVRTRKLTPSQILEVDKWLDEHAMGKVTIRGAPYKVFIQQYCAEVQTKKKVHILKVAFFNETDARRFLMDWG